MTYQIPQQFPHLKQLDFKSLCPKLKLPTVANMKRRHLHTFNLSGIQKGGGSDSDQNGQNSTTDLLSQASSSPGISEFVGAWARKSFQKKNLVRKLPILSWIREYNLTKLIADVIAGLTLGLTTIPQVLGVANVAEMPPEYSLYSSFIGPFVYIFLGSTKYITIGPTVTTAIITLSYTKNMPPEFSVLLAFLSGVVTLVMSFLQLGFIVNLISKPVISGFTSAAAISITSTQIKSLLGLSFSANGFVEEVSGVIENIGDTQWQDSVVSLISLISLYFLMKIESIFAFMKPGPKASKFLWVLSTSRSVSVVLITTIIFGVIGNPSPVLLVGNVPSGMPSFKPPPFSFSSINGNFTLGSALREKTSALIVIPLLSFMEMITIAKAFGGTDRIDGNQELLSLGVSNILGSFFSSMPVTGAFGRTALNYAAGAQSPFAGLLTGVIIILALVVLTPQFYWIPKSALSAVVVMAVIFMVDFDILKSIWKSKRLDLIPWAVTFLVSLFIGLEYGIMSGFVVSLVYLLYYASRPGVKVSYGEVKEEKFLWVEVDRSLTFPSMEYTRYTLMKAAGKWGQGMSVVLDARFVTLADYSSAQGISDILKLFRDKGQRIILWNVKPSVRGIWENVIKSQGIAEPIFCVDDSELEIALRIEKEKNEKDAKLEIETNNNLGKEE